MSRKIHLALATAAACFAAAPAFAQTNLVQNGGFEQGGTTESGIADWNGNGAYQDNITPHSGTFEAGFGVVAGLSSLDQLISTVAGQTYTFSFYLQSEGGSPSEFQAYFGDQQVYDATDLPENDGYLEKSFQVTATGSSTDVRFAGRDDPAFLHLDDVSVTANPAAVSAAPEPGAWALMLGGVAMLGAMLRIRKARRDEDAVSDIATA